MLPKRHIRELKVYELPIASTRGVIPDYLHLTVRKLHIGVITVILMFHQKLWHISNFILIWAEF